MESLTIYQLFIAALIVLSAYVVRGIAGFGSGLIAIPLLALLLPLPMVVPIIALLDYVASAGHGVKHRQAIQWSSLLPLLPFTTLGVLTALYLFHTVDAQLLSKALAVFIILYSAYSLLAPEPKGQGSRWWAVPAGSFGGLIGTLFGTGGPFYVIYLKLRGLDKTAFRATIAVSFLIDGGMRLTGYLISGFYDLQTMLMIAAGVPIMVVGMYVGGHIHTNLSQQAFQRMISVVLVGSGISLLLK